ncbi:hypothetical protein FOZ62_000214, partial [Perkinsus olseni]
LLEVIEFDNDRKRMSVLVKIISPLAEEDGSESLTTTTRILLLIKGADSSMKDIWVKPSRIGGTVIIDTEELESVLDALSAGGLRTLVYGVRDLTSDMPFVESWRRSYNDARGLVGVAKERALKQCIEEMECDIDIVGCTGIEDKLQDYVPDTIADLHEAGIKVWVLTGDKIETAINIAYLRQLRSSLATLEWDDLAEVKLAKRGLLSVSSIEMDADPPMASALPLSGQGRGEEAEKEPTTSLTDVGDEQLEGEEEGACIEMNKPAISSPSSSSWTSVAITISGDSLAVVLKDRPLRKKFFKFTLSHCITVIACRVSPKQKAQIFSGTSLYDPILKQGYNVIFTLLPILLYGIFDRQLPTNITSSCPYLYLWPGISLKRLCRMKCTSRKLIRLKFSPFNLFGNKHLLLWLLAAAWVSVCSTVPPMVYLYYASIDSNGKSSPPLAGVGSLIFLHIIILCNFVVYMLSNTRYWFTHVGIIGGIVAYLLVWVILTEVSSPEAGRTTMIFSPSAGAVLLSGLGIAFLPFVLYHQYKPLFSPGNAQLVKERLSLGLPVQLSELYSTVDDHQGPEHPKDLQSSSTAHLSHQQLHLVSPRLSHPRHVTTIVAGPVPSRVLDGDIGLRRAATLASRGFGFDEVSRIDRIGKYRSVDTISLAGSSPVSRHHQRRIATVDWGDTSATVSSDYDDHFSSPYAPPLRRSAQHTAWSSSAISPPTVRDLAEFSARQLMEKRPDSKD